LASWDRLKPPHRKLCRDKAIALGTVIAASDAILLTGRLPGWLRDRPKLIMMPGACTWAFPAADESEHVERYGLPPGRLRRNHLYRLGLKGRNVVLVRS